MATPASERPEIAMGLYNDRDSYGSLLTFPSDAMAHSMLMIFRSYEYRAPGDSQLLELSEGTLTQLRRLSGIELPIPANLRDTDSLRIDRFEQGFLESLAGNAVAKAYQAVDNSNLTLGQIPGEIQRIGADLASGSNISAALGGIMDRIGSIPGMNASAIARDASYLLRSSLPSNINRVADAIIGSTVNPRASLAFEGVELKNHSFSWTLAPKNARESDTLNAIIRTLKRNSLPSYQTISGTSFKAYLKYPSIVDVYLLGVNSEYFMKFKPAMIRSMNFDYGSTGLVSLVKGGKPAVVNITLDLYEMDIHTANDYGVPISSTPAGGGPTTGPQ